jgi:hypothetical protein
MAGLSALKRPTISVIRMENLIVVSFSKLQYRTGTGISPALLNDDLRLKIVKYRVGIPRPE